MSERNFTQIYLIRLDTSDEIIGDIRQRGREYLFQIKKQGRFKNRRSKIYGSLDEAVTEANNFLMRAYSIKANILKNKEVK